MKESKNKNKKRYPESLGKFSISNFRVFETETSFDFKPLTFLVGPNSSGKSSLMKLLSSISSSTRSFKQNNFVPRVIGSSNDEDASMRFSFNTSMSKVDEPLTIIFLDATRKFQKLDVQFKLSYILSETLLNHLRLSRFEIIRKNKTIFKVVKEDNKGEDWIISISYKDYYALGIDYINASIEEMKANKDLMFFEESDLEDALNSETVFEFPSNDFLTYISIKEIEDKVFQIENFESNSGLNRNFNQNMLLGGHISYDEYVENGLKGFINYMFYFIKGYISKENNDPKIIDELKLTSLGNVLIKELPESITTELNKHLKSNISFNRAPVFKSERGSVFNLLENHNTAYGLLVKSYIEQNKRQFNQGDLQSNDYIDYWLNRFDIGTSLVIKPIESSHQYFKIEILKNGGQKINIADLGYGAGQVLALILLPYYANVDFHFVIASMTLSDLTSNTKKKKSKDHSESERKIQFNPHLLYNGQIQTHLVYLEEPETNLHPNWQSILAELFAYQIKIGIRFVIETHSEYFIRKIQNLVGVGEFDYKDTVIYYFNSEEEKKRNGLASVNEIKINKNGTLSNSFGSGFFDEAGKLSLELLSINSIRKN